jgi:putative tricarboxylic transport membrane protein
MNATCRRGTVLWLLSLAAGLALCQSAVAQGWTPQRNVELIAPNAPGGSLDASARLIQQLWQIPVSSTVVNRAGGEHAIAYTFLSQRTGDAHFLSVASPVLLSNHISGRMQVTYTDVTPIATLITESYLFVVRADSPLKTGRDMVEALRKSPDALAISVGTIATRMAVGVVLQAANIDIKPVKMVIIEGGKQAITALGGHVDVALGPPVQFMPLIEGGKIRVIAVSSSRRLGGVLASVPTWAELGYKASSETWRAVIAPKGITPAQIAYWEGTLRKVTENEEFRRSVEKNLSEVVFRGAAETRSHMESEYEQSKSVMRYLGLIK